METVPDRLSAVKQPIDVNECRAYTFEELKALTGMSVEFWRSEVAAGRIPHVRLGSGGRNDRIRITHPDLHTYLRDHRQH